MPKHRRTNSSVIRPQRKRRRATLPLAQQQLEQQQPYDNLMKSLFAGNEQQAINAFLPGAEYLETLNVEVLRTPMRVDCAYKILYKHLDHILHVEFESGSNPRMGARLHNYHAHLHYKYDLPVISVIIYLFPTTMVKSPFREMSGDVEIVTFRFHTIALWKEEASKYLQQHLVNLYPLLPAMAHVDKSLLSQALEEMVQYYKDDETKLGEQLRWLGVLLRRADTVPLDDKEAVQEEMNMFNKLLEEDPYLQQKIATGVSKGIAKREIELEARKRELEAHKRELEAHKRELEERAAKMQAEAEERAAKMQAEAQSARASLENTAMHIVGGRFPQLLPLAQEKLPRIKAAERLGMLVEQLALAPNEETASWLLNTL